MIFHENRLHIIPSIFRKLRKMSHNVSSAAVVIGTLRVKMQRVYDYNNLQGLIFLYMGVARLLVKGELLKRELIIIN